MFGKPTRFEIGKNGTAEEFCAAYKKAQKKENLYGRHTRGSDQRNLLRGAFQAFQEGRIENVQAILANPADFTIFDDYYYSNVTPEYTLSRITQGHDDPVAIIDLALSAFSEQKKYNTLNSALVGVIRSKSHAEPETFITVLLEAGASANCADGDFKGIALARAIEAGQPLSVVKLLYDNSASFDDALFLMKANKWNAETITSLEGYREKITGKPAASATAKPDAAPDADVKTLLLQIQEQISDLTGQVNKLAERIDKIAPPASVKPAAKKPYPRPFN